MKKAIQFVSRATLVACACLFLNGSAVAKDKGFTVKGILEGKIAYLVSTVPGAADTLATGAIKNGKFQLTGTVEKLTIARLGVKGQAPACTIYLENDNTYTVQDGRVKAATSGQERLELFDGVLQTFTSLLAKVNANMSLLRTSTEFRDGILVEANSLQNRLNDLVKADPDSELSAYLLYAIEAAGGDASKQVDLLGANAKATAYGKALKALNPAAAAAAHAATYGPSVKVGEIAPDFTLPTPAGENLSLHGVKAKVKLIDFWASWCGPCRSENPNVVKVYAEYHPKGLEIIGVSLDNNREAWLKAIDADHLTWLHASDLLGWQAAPAQLYGVKGIPCTVLLDENNKIIALNLRGDALKAKIAELLD
jgi:thiol-disulfide isomerase/thioredoxin